MSIVKTTLGNGLVVASDLINNFETVSVGIFVNVGSVNETSRLSGVSHFVEHMAFKGTTNRSAIEVSRAIESAGGYMNAYTGKEITAYYCKVLKEDLETAVDVIMDIVQNSTFDSAEFEKERGVIVQEIKKYDDTPDELVFDLFQMKSFDGEALGMPILGTINNINSFSPCDLRDYLKSNYSTKRMILAASGNVDHNQLVELANKYSSNLTNFDSTKPDKQTYRGGFEFREKDLEQHHVVVGFEGVSNNDPDRFGIAILASIMGGGMSSRLFQEVREKRGLAYSIFSYTANYSDTGIFGVYFGCDANNSRDVVKIIQSELQQIAVNVTEKEILDAKTQIKSAFLMGLESSSTRMERMACNYLLNNGHFFTSEEISKMLDEITVDSLRESARRINSSKPTMAVVGSGKGEVFDNLW